MAGQPGFFDLSDRYEALSAAGDPLERLAAVVDFEVFRGPLRYLTVLSIFVCPSKIWTARRFPVAL